jgi:sulfate adenylyltransferase subunit 1 (EFTu-like GTPase family)
VKTQTGDVITVSPPAIDGDVLSVLFLNNVKHQAPARRTIELTREEAVELGRQLITAARGRRMIVVAAADVATAEPA